VLFKPRFTKIIKYNPLCLSIIISIFQELLIDNQDLTAK